MSASWIVLILALWVTVVALVVLVLGLMRRISILEGSLSSIDRTRRQRTVGPTVGEHLPEVAGYESVLRSGVAGRSQVVVFLSATCGMCRRLAEEFKAAELAHPAGSGWDDSVALLFVTDDDDAMATLGQCCEVVTQLDGAITRAWGIPGTPYAVAIGGDGQVLGSSFVTTWKEVATVAGLSVSARPPASFAETTEPLQPNIAVRR